MSDLEVDTWSGNKNWLKSMNKKILEQVTISRKFYIQNFDEFLDSLNNHFFKIYQQR